MPSVSENVEAVVNDGFKNLPDTVTVDNISSERENVEDIFISLYTSLLIAVIAVIIGTSIGLSLFGSITVMLTVLISIFIGLIPVPWLGVDLNQISVIGLIIALGILVDDSIVVNDNIERRFSLGDSKSEAIYNGVKEVAPSVIASTAAIVFTFSPLLLSAQMRLYKGSAEYSNIYHDCFNGARTDIYSSYASCDFIKKGT